MVKSSKWIDVLSLILSSILITIGMESLRVSGERDYSHMLIETAMMSLSFLVILFAFRKRERIFNIPPIVFTVLLGLSLWLICHSILGVFLDWKYISAHPENAFDRHLQVFQALLIFIPVFAIITFGIVLIMRLIAYTIANQKSSLK